MKGLAIVRMGVDVPYEQAWTLQRRLHARRAAGEISDLCLMVEHAPVYTAGKRTLPHERPADGTPVIDVDRGGQITWHGPGQLVAYPIVGVGDVPAYVRLLEDVVIQVCADVGLAARRIKGRGGIWLPADAERGRPVRRLGTIGIRVSRGVSMHGFALDCVNDLSWYNRLMPGAVGDTEVTSLSAETGRRITVDEVVPFAEKRLAEALGAEPYEMYEEDLA
ncbi:lipoyl(octanoyl) transferase LipB [Microbispora sp. RL4-1S]|uniref:Octanoyltransferase n=1 Tax=Microbispora oryzae TaxID=2806554 RepID=A0A940WJ56_9ACTN|nr:lipoyl(octanoyl) transferase LipB [Microbispora oryzae]MBP2702510.1 lipoyl(octanoyl) transferase LipB [Microbispora oryzae]